MTSFYGGFNDYSDFGDFGSNRFRFNRRWSTIRKDPVRPSIIKTRPKTYRGKTYDDLKAECLKDGSLFEDPDFPATDKNIFYSKQPPRPFEWLRPTEIAEKYGGSPRFMVDGTSRFDIKQGELGDCWLLAALASLCEYPPLMDNVVCEGQTFEEGEYAGIFKFRFWVFGTWKEVIIDDRLPTYNGRLVFLHSADNTEFWSSLLEKAYAKLHGSYEALKSGVATEAFEDFTGGVGESFELGDNAPPNLLKIMLKAISKQTLMSCSIEDDSLAMEDKLSNGLVAFHAYSITAVKLVEIKTMSKEGKIPLVRLRNPWGNEAEWKGRWSDQSSEWQLIPAEEKEDIGLVFDKDGEFWMSFNDFVKNFSKMEIGFLSVDSLDEGQGLGAANRSTYEMTVLEGSWVKNVSAGGCRNNLDTFWINPQFHFEVVDVDEDDPDNLGSVFIALMQKGMRKKYQEGVELLTMGYAIYKLDEPNTQPLGRNFFAYTRMYEKSPNFVNTREVSGRHSLPPGHYLLVPSTFDVGQEADFMIRLFSETPVPTEEVDDTTDINEVKPEVKPTEEDTEVYDSLKQAYKKIAGADMVIDSFELRDILNAVFLREFSFEGFSVETCRSLVATKDVDKSGKLEFMEFKVLWDQIRAWKTAFKKQDVDKNGSFNGFELRETLKEIGYSVSNQTLNVLVQRYSRKDGRIQFDDFILLVAKLTTMFDIFKEISGGKRNADFSLEAFIQTTMYS